MIYDKSTRELMKQFAAEKLEKSKVFSKRDAVSWFQERYPKIDPHTVQLHVERMAVNNAKYRRSATPTAGKDLFFKLGPNSFRLWDQEHDPAPIYGPPREKALAAYPLDEDEIEEGEDEEEDEDEVNDNAPAMFSKNTIFYGCPGTGKTFNAINRAVAILDYPFYVSRSSIPALSRNRCHASFAALSLMGNTRSVGFASSGLIFSRIVMARVESGIVLE